MKRHKIWAEKILKHAQERYASKRFAWHYIVETHTVDDIVESFAEFPPSSYQQALANYRRIAKSYLEQEREVQAA